MKSFKSDKGAITIVVLVTIFFILSFLLSSYAIITSKVKNQKEMIAETKNIYAPKATMEEIYNSYFNTDEVIPIRTVEQLLAIGTGRTLSINGKIYAFSKNSAYALMNDLSFDVDDWQSVLGQGNNWLPIGFTGIAFEGNNHKITVTKLNNSTSEYNKLNGYMNTIPNDYIELEYIKGTGTQYINTGIYLTNEDRISVDVELTTINNITDSIMGSRVGYSSKNFMIARQPTGYGLCCDFNNSNGDTYRYNNTSYTSGGRYTIYNNKDSRGILGIGESKVVCSDVFTCTTPCYIGNASGNPPASSKPYSGKIYGARIEGKFYGIPCLDDNNVPCLYDLITETAFYNQGSGDDFSYKLTIPIYNVEQLLAIGTGRILSVNGKTYTFSKDSTYSLMNDLSFDVDDWKSVLGEGNNWLPIGFTDIGFEGNNHTITVTKLNNSTTEYNKLNGYMNTIPNDYTELEYIKGTGTQYINTGIYLTNEDRISVDVELTAINNNTDLIMGSRVGYSSKNFMIARQPKGYGLCCDFNNSNGDTYRYKNTSYTSGGRYTIYNNKDSRGILGIGESKVVCSDVFTCTTPCYIGNASGNPPSSSKAYSGKIYGARIEGKFYGIPCLDNNNVPCLYDLITETAFYNQGSGDDFSYGLLD